MDDSFQKLNEIIERVHQAQMKFTAYTQEQVDAIFHNAAAAATANRIPLAKMAVEETGMGVLEDKVIKNHFASEYIYNQYKDSKTCGIIEDDPVSGYREIAAPLGIVAGILCRILPDIISSVVLDQIAAPIMLMSIFLITLFLFFILRVPLSRLHY